MLKFDVRAVRVLAPALPGLIATQLFRRHFHARLFQFVGNGVDVVHFKTEMMDALAGIFGLRIRLEKFDELSPRDLEVKAEQLAVFVKIEVRREAEGIAVKVAGAREVFGEDAEMGEGFDHGVIELKKLAMKRRKGA